MHPSLSQKSPPPPAGSLAGLLSPAGSSRLAPTCGLQRVLHQRHLGVCILPPQQRSLVLPQRVCQLQRLPHVHLSLVQGGKGGGLQAGMTSVPEQAGSGPEAQPFHTPISAMPRTEKEAGAGHSYGQAAGVWWGPPTMPAHMAPLAVHCLPAAPARLPGVPRLPTWRPPPAHLASPPAHLASPPAHLGSPPAHLASPPAQLAPPARPPRAPRMPTWRRTKSMVCLAWLRR